MAEEEPERLAPPPFWRTRYFAFDVMPRRPELDPIEIKRIIDQPEYKLIQPDGRIRLYGRLCRQPGMLSARCATIGR
jgi:hypothetical protein